jgi:hypothetical protein
MRYKRKNRKLYINPVFEEYLGVDDFTNETGKNDTEEQAKLRSLYPTREAYIQDLMRQGTNRVNATLSWGGIWAGNPNEPQPFLMPNNIDAYDTGNPNIDFFGYEKAYGGYVSMNIPQKYYLNEWLAKNPDYEYVGWQGNSSNFTVSKRRTPPPPSSSSSSSSSDASSFPLFALVKFRTNVFR